MLLGTGVEDGVHESDINEIFLLVLTILGVVNIQRGI